MNIAAAFLQQHRKRLGLDALGIGDRPPCLVLTPRFEASRHVVFLVMAHDRPWPILVVKIPRLIETPGSLAREAGSLRAVQGLRPGGFASVPRVVAFEEFCGRVVLVETALSGPLMAPRLVRRRPDDCCRRVLDWLVDLQQASRRAAHGRWFDTLVDEPFDYFAAVFPLAGDDATLLARTREIVAPLRYAGLPFVCEHGDLSHPNLVLNGAGVAVLDWELARMEGLVGYDFFIFLAYVAFSRWKATSATARLKAFEDAFFGPGAWTLPLMRGYAGRMNVPSDALRPLFVLSWARYTIHLLQRLTSGDGAADRPVSPQMAATLRVHRYFRMWRHAAANHHRLAWAS